MPVTAKKVRLETTIKEMGLQDVKNTRIGKASDRSLSNGQKGRLSIYMEILARPNLLFLDEPTSGLDSAASDYVIRRIVNLALQDVMTVVASIHQPSSEAFELFHHLCLLSSGKNVYFGPREGANEFFAVILFHALVSKIHQIASSIINTDFGEDMELGYYFKITNEETIDMLVKSYNSSDIYKQTKEQIAEITVQGGEALQKRSPVSFFTQCLILTKRSLVNMNRDIGYYWVRLAIHIAVSLGLGNNLLQHSLFPQLHRGQRFDGRVCCFFHGDDGDWRFPFFYRVYEGKYVDKVCWYIQTVFRTERLNGHYSAGAFVISNALSSVIYLITISLIAGAIAHYLVRLHQGCERFLNFSLVLFLCMMLVETLMMIVASILPDIVLGLVAGDGIQGLMTLSGGFFQLPSDLPLIVWKYPLYYISFHRYAYQGLYMYEYEGLTSLEKGSRAMTGEEVLREIWQVEAG